MKNCFVIIISLLVINIGLQSQNEFSIGAGAGLMYYLGDLNPNSVTAPPEFFRPSANLYVSYYISNYFQANLNYLKGSIYASDKVNEDNEWKQVRNLHFKSPIDEISVSFNLKYPTTIGMVPYVSLGAGVLWFNPMALYKNKWYELQPLGTEGQFINKPGYPKPYSLVQLTLPLAIGIEFKVAKKIGIRIEASLHQTFTDYLDDVSTLYPDSADLAKTPNGETALNLSYKGKGNFPIASYPRGNATYNDNLVNYLITFIYYLNTDERTLSKIEKFNFH